MTIYKIQTTATIKLGNGQELHIPISFNVEAGFSGASLRQEIANVKEAISISLSDKEITEPIGESFIIKANKPVSVMGINFDKDTISKIMRYPATHTFAIYTIDGKNDSTITLGHLPFCQENEIVHNLFDSVTLAR